jgi:hypothetical protein
LNFDLLKYQQIKTSIMSNRDRNRDRGAESKRDKAQSHDYKGEAQNVNDNNGRPMNEEEPGKARNKATEGIRQNRDEDAKNG